MNHKFFVENGVNSEEKNISAPEKRVEEENHLPSELREEIIEKIKKQGHEIWGPKSSGPEVPQLVGRAVGSSEGRQETEDAKEAENVKKAGNAEEAENVEETGSAEEAENVEKTENAEEAEAEKKSPEGEKKYPCDETIGGVKCYFDDNGNLYRVGDELRADAIYEINGYTYKTDSKGRIISAEGTLRIKEHEGRYSIKDKMDKIGKGDQADTDERGHLIGDQFEGDPTLANLVPMDAKLNGTFEQLENQLAKEIKAGKEVIIRIDNLYEDSDSHRPTAFVVSYSIDGERNERIYYNGKEQE